MSQSAVNVIHRSCRELTHRLRYFLATDPKRAELLDANFTEHLHEMICERAGFDPNLATGRSKTDTNRVHPWNRLGTNRTRKPKGRN